MITSRLEIKDANRLRRFKEEDYLASSSEINEFIDKILWLQTITGKIKGIWKWISYEVEKILLHVKSIFKKDDTDW